MATACFFVWTRAEVDKVCQARMIFDKEKSETPHCAMECLNLSPPSAPLNTSAPATLSQEQQCLGGFLESALE